MKKLSLALALLLVIGLLAACGSPNTSTPSGSTSTLPSSGDASVDAYAEAYEGQLPLSPEKVTLKFATHQGTNASIAIPGNDLPLYQWLEEVTNVHIEWEVVPYDTYKDTMSTRLAGGGALPDILNLQDLGNEEQLALDGIIIPQTELIEKYGYYTKQFFEANPAYRSMFAATDGEMYAIKCTTLDSDLGLGICMNKYAVERVGLQTPTTVDEFYDTLVAFRDKEGMKTPLFADKEGVRFMGTYFGLESVYGPMQYFTAVDGELVNIYTLPEYKEYITFMNKLYTEGLINKDFMTAGWDQISEAIANNDTGAVAFWNTYCTWYGDPSPDAKQFTDAGEDPQQNPIFVPLDPLKSPSGEDTYFVRRIERGGDGMGITTECPEDLQPVAMKWIDFLFNSPESLRAQVFGVEGLTYEMNGDEVTKLDPPEGMDWSTWVTSVGGNQPPRAHQQNLEAWHQSWLYDWAYDIDMHQKQFYKDPTIIPIPFTIDEENTATAAYATLDPYLDGSIAQFISGEKPMSDWDKFIEEMGPMGMDSLHEVFTSRYQRQLEAAA